MRSQKIGVVGACGAGKSTLAAGLRACGYLAKPIAQEHSYVPYMWQRITKPDILIYLGVSFENTIARRKLNWRPDEYQQQLQRLEHARQHAHLIISTDSLTSEEVLSVAVRFLENQIGQ